MVCNVVFVVFWGTAARNKHTVPYYIVCNVDFFVFWGTLLRPTAGAVVLIVMVRPWKAGNYPKKAIGPF